MTVDDGIMAQFKMIEKSHKKTNENSLRRLFK